MHVIPWGALVRDASSWISSECSPRDFQWKDPSKIQVGEVFRLLDHWRDRQDKGLDPLIWVPTCPLFDDIPDHSKLGRNIRQLQDSDEEVFDFPLSGDSDKQVDEPDHEESSEESPPVDTSSDQGKSLSLNMESPTMPMSRLPDSYSCKHPVHFHSLKPSHIHHIPVTGDGGEAALFKSQPTHGSKALGSGLCLIYYSYIQPIIYSML
jgi:hypothetical protein